MKRRALLAAGLGATSLPAAIAAAGDAPEAAALWRTLFAPPPGGRYAWWFRGTMFAHVDGLREFPVVAHDAVMLCATRLDGDETIVAFRTIGCFGDIETGQPATRWANVFRGSVVEIPRRFVEGPGRYRLAAATGALSLECERVRSNRTTLGASAADGHATLTQIESTLQGLPRLDGSPPPQGSPDITERQTRWQLVAGNGAQEPVRGFYTQVYDALPSWLGFGDTLGSALTKGVMRRAAVGEAVDPGLARRLERLFGAGALRAWP